jgi:hypothetical protein
MEENIYEKYYGKVVATRGYVSGVNVGRLVYFNPITRVLILTDSYFLRKWKYQNSYGSMASLSSGDIIEGGEITKIHDDTIIIDAGQFVICPDSILTICKKCAK